MFTRVPSISEQWFNESEFKSSTMKLFFPAEVLNKAMLHVVAKISDSTLCVDEYVSILVKILCILPMHLPAFAICKGTRSEELLQV